MKSILSNRLFSCSKAYESFHFKTAGNSCAGRKNYLFDAKEHDMLNRNKVGNKTSNLQVFSHCGFKLCFWDLFNVLNR